MDTGTAGKLTITGNANLMLGAQGNIVNNPNGALVEAAGIYTAATGVAMAGGRIAAIDASALTGNLTLVLDNILDVGKADTSGVLQNVAVTGGSGNDTFVLYDAVQAGDSINGGAGNDTLLFYSGASVASAVTSVEAGQMLNNAVTFPLGVATATATAIALDYDFLPDATGMLMRNISNNGTTNFAGGVATFTNYDMTAAQAAALTIQHSTTGNGQITNNIISAAVKTNTAADLVGVTIAEGTNVDPRFNFTLNGTVANTATSTTAAASTFESVTITDSDTESNSVNLANVATHTGTITLTGGLAGTFLNLDTTTGGLTNRDLSGLATGDGFLNTATVPVRVAGAQDLSTTTLNRVVAATVNAANELSDVTVRVGTNAASVVGAQAITMGAGNDTVIFDNVNDTRAGLTISDTVMGGAGQDTLVIDGNLAVAGVIALSASEWTNVSGFETIRLINPGAGSTYSMVLTDALIAANNNAGILAIVNDNDSQNDTANLVNVGVTAAEAAVVLDARTLNATSRFSYNGEEGISATNDRFIMSDANVNGGNVIDGGARSNNDGLVATVANAAIDKAAGVTYDTNAGGTPGNGDVMEIRNAAIATTGDLANLKNIGTLSFTNDTASIQASVLQLNDTVVDLLVNSYHTASATAIGGVSQVETLYVNAIDNTLVAGAFTTLNIDASALTAKSSINAIGGGGVDVVLAGAGADFIQNKATFAAGGTTASAADVLSGNAGNDTFLPLGSNASAATYAGVSRVTDFSFGVGTTSVAAAGEGSVSGTDILGLSATLTNYTGTSAFAAGVVAAAAGATSIQSVVQNAAAAAYVAGTDLIKLTTGVAAGVSAQATFNAAIGTGTVTGLTAGDDIFVTFYDITNSRAVVALVDSTATTNTIVESGDTITVVGTMNMTAADYAGFTNANLQIFA